MNAVGIKFLCEKMPLCYDIKHNVLNNVWGKDIEDMWDYHMNPQAPCGVGIRIHPDYSLKPQRASMPRHLEKRRGTISSIHHERKNTTCPCHRHFSIKIYESIIFNVLVFNKRHFNFKRLCSTIVIMTKNCQIMVSPLKKS